MGALELTRRLTHAVHQARRVVHGLDESSWVPRNFFVLMCFCVFCLLIVLQEPCFQEDKALVEDMEISLGCIFHKSIQI